MQHEEEKKAHNTKYTLWHAAKVGGRGGDGEEGNKVLMSDLVPAVMVLLVISITYWCSLLLFSGRVLARLLRIKGRQCWMRWCVAPTWKTQEWLRCPPCRCWTSSMRCWKVPTMSSMGGSVKHRNSPSQVRMWKWSVQQKEVVCCCLQFCDQLSDCLAVLILSWIFCCFAFVFSFCSFSVCHAPSYSFCFIFYLPNCLLLFFVLNFLLLFFCNMSLAHEKTKLWF